MSAAAPFGDHQLPTDTHEPISQVANAGIDAVRPAGLKTGQRAEERQAQPQVTWQQRETGLTDLSVKDSFVEPPSARVDGAHAHAGAIKDNVSEQV